MKAVNITISIEVNDSFDMNDLGNLNGIISEELSVQKKVVRSVLTYSWQEEIKNKEDES